MSEQQGADEGYLRQHRKDDGLQLDARQANEAFAQHAGNAKTENGQRKASRHLVGNERQRQETEEQRENRARRDTGQNAKIGRTGHMRGSESADRTHDHHALDAEIKDAGAFRHQLARGGKDERCGGSDDREKDGLKHIHHAAPWLLCALPVKTTLMR